MKYESNFKEISKLHLLVVIYECTSLQRKHRSSRTQKLEVYYKNLATSMKTLLLTPEKGTYAIFEPELTETVYAFYKLILSKYGKNSDI